MIKLPPHVLEPNNSGAFVPISKSTFHRTIDNLKTREFQIRNSPSQPLGTNYQPSSLHIREHTEKTPTPKTPPKLQARPASLIMPRSPECQSRPALPENRAKVAVLPLWHYQPAFCPTGPALAKPRNSPFTSLPPPQVSSAH